MIYPVAIYRVSNWLYRKKLKWLANMLNHFNQIINACDIHPSAEIGKGFSLGDHSVGLVIVQEARIGNNCKIFNNSIIGRKMGVPKSPIIKDNVIVGANSVILGAVTIGENSVIGAGSFINKDIPPNKVAYNKRELVIR